MVNQVITSAKTKAFDLPKRVYQVGAIQNILEKGFSLAEEIFRSRVIVTTARYLDLVEPSTLTAYRVTHDYPEQFFHLYEQLCEYCHYLVKIEVGYLNVLERGAVDSFRDGAFSTYQKYFESAKLYQSLALIDENKTLGKFFTGAIDRNLRNGIAHRHASFVEGGQNINVQSKSKTLSLDYTESLVKLVRLCRCAIFGLGIVTDVFRLISDKAWEF